MNVDEKGRVVSGLAVVIEEKHCRSGDDRRCCRVSKVPGKAKDKREADGNEQREILVQLTTAVDTKDL